MPDRVAITGLGLTCALGTSQAQVIEGLRAGRRAFAKVAAFDATGFKVDLAAEVPAFDAEGRFGRSALRHTSRTDRLALWAAADALAQAGLAPTAQREAAVYVGASTGGMVEMETARRGGGRVPFGTYWRYPVWATSLAIGRVLGLRGPRSTYMTACSSAAHAIGLAMQRVRSGELPVALAGGAESLSRMTLAGFGALGVLDPEGTRPFDAARRGITLGEGAAFFVLEPLAAAQRRGAVILGVVAGYGAGADAHHMIHPREDGEGAVRAIRWALEDAGVAADDVDYVNAHGTGTTQNDSMEAKAFRRVFGERGLRVSSSKSMLGHTLGAAAAVEAAVTVAAMSAGFCPPNPGVSQPAAELSGLELVRTATAGAPTVTVSTSFAFGGNNAALVLLSPAAVQRGLGHPRPASRRGVLVSGAAVATSAGTATDAAGVFGLLERPASGAALTGLDPTTLLGRATVRRMDALSAATAAVCSLARESAGLGEVRDLGIGFGTSFGGLEVTFAFLERMFEKGPSLVNPMDFPNLVHNAGAGHTSMVLSATGPNVTATQEELAGDDALRALAERVAQGDLPAAITGGADLGCAALDAGYALVDRVLGTRSQHSSVAAALTLEGDDACRHRGGTPWARLVAAVAAGPSGSVRAAITRLLASAAATADLPAHADLWLRGATEQLGRSHESAAADLPFVAGTRSIEARVRLGDAGGAGAAVIAVAAAAIRTGKARWVLVTSVTREGGCVATLLGPAT
jgi:3-oxoacyl-[acyl-carrier-protein] synthase II